MSAYAAADVFTGNDATYEVDGESYALSLERTASPHVAKRVLAAYQAVLDICPSTTGVSKTNTPVSSGIEGAVVTPNGGHMDYEVGGVLVGITVTKGSGEHLAVLARAQHDLLTAIFRP